LNPQSLLVEPVKVLQLRRQVDSVAVMDVKFASGPHGQRITTRNAVNVHEGV
jgi:hypothetical protein